MPGGMVHVGTVTVAGLPPARPGDGDAADTNRFAAAFFAGPASMGDATERMQEIGRQVAVPTPNIDALFGLARLQAQVRGLY